MNFTRFSMLYLGALLLAFAGCKPATEKQTIQGDLQVQIPFPDSTGGNSQYVLKTVTLKGISNLQEVRGQYAQFFYSPGMIDEQLSGGAPRAYFVKTSNQVYIAKDIQSLQMATLYYHMQNLILNAESLGIQTHSAFQIGLNTKIKGDSSLQENNAFFDGRSKAMLFVPYTAQEMPISVNAGIIAHEYFHSIFYKKVLEPLEKKHISTAQKISTDSVHSLDGWSLNSRRKSIDLSEVELFNETFLRGINEGLADYWGWAYTGDPDFIKWSLSIHAKARSLSVTENFNYKTTQDIIRVVSEAKNISDEPSVMLSNYIYDIGTPYARFLKDLVLAKSQNEGLTQKEAKQVVGQFLIRFIEQLGAKALALKSRDRLSADSFFIESAKGLMGAVTQAHCELVIKYLNSPLEIDAVIAKKYSCEKEQSSDSYKLVEP